MRSLPRYTEGLAQHMYSTLPRLTSRLQVGWHESTILSLLHIAEAKEGPGGSKVGQHGFIKSIHCTGHSLGSGSMQGLHAALAAIRTSAEPTTCTGWHSGA